MSEDICWRKKRLLQTKDWGEWGHTYGTKEKKIPKKWWGHSLKKKQKIIKEKKSGEWGHLFREKKRHYKQKIVVSEDTLLG